MRGARALVWVAVTAALAACWQPLNSSLYRDRLRVTEMQRVAVLPLENLTADTYASDVVTGLLTNSLYATGRFRILEKNEALRKLKAADVALPTAIDAATAQKIGRELGVDGVFVGTITEYTYLFYPEDAVVGLSVSLIDTETGLTVWTGLFNDRNRGLLQGNDDPITGLAESGIAKLVSQLAPAPGTVAGDMHQATGFSGE